MHSDKFLFSRQFLLTKHVWSNCQWPAHTLADYTLYTHPALECAISKVGDLILITLGFAFDYRKPERSNQEISDTLIASKDIQTLFAGISHLGGHFVILYLNGQDFIAFSDACGQRELYYDTNLEAVGSQPKLLQQVIDVRPWKDQQDRAFYQSDPFLRSKIFVGGYTHWENVRHLQPNHYLDLKTGQAVRYFPRRVLETIPTEEAASRAITVLRGYLKAASLRYPLQLGVTAGYDSRILFLATQDLECQYYVSRNGSKFNAIDIDIGSRVAALYGHALDIRQSNTEITDPARAIQDQSLDFPRYQSLPLTPSTHMTISGNLSEIARNYYGEIDYRTGADLAQPLGLGGQIHAERAFDQWLRSGLPHFQACGYDYRDLFYWEERAGNWAAKGKTEGLLRGVVYSPFSSHLLLETLLSTDRSDRDKHFNKLYDTILLMLSPRALDIPVNPNPRIRMIKALKRLGIYHLYRRTGLRLGLLKS